MGPLLEEGEYQTGARFYTHYGVNDVFHATNVVDEDDNPIGGIVESTGLKVEWQNGPRGQEGTDELAAPNGAFVEDVLYAAMQRLEFFNKSKYSDRANSIAITKIQEAMQAMKHRSIERSYRGVEGKHEV